MEQDIVTNGMRSAVTCTACTPIRAEQAIDLLNKRCFCMSLEEGALKRALNTEVPEVFALIEQRCPYLFSARPVFVSQTQTDRIAQLIRAVESVIALPAYRKQIMANAPDIARHDPGGALGVFYGYDFHLDEDGIGLIEINTNAGGAMLNVVLARAQHACCPAMEEIVSTSTVADALEQRIVDMFQSEWRLSKRDRPLQTIAIVDDAPERQYLYPEFLLLQQLFQRHGMQAVIVDPSTLKWRDGILWHEDTAIDLVYNRLTDFMLEAPASSALRDAYLAHAIVLTPHPQAHALYADKRNLALLSDPEQLNALGVSQDAQDILLAHIPRTEIVSMEHAERMWRDRRHLFFKPKAGFGGRAAYRGDKLTKRVWQEILTGDYVAQAMVVPGERVIGTQDNSELLKFDIRIYAYCGQVQWTAARMYQGQTTNFRTPGGGFAPVYSIPDGELISGIEAIGRLVTAEDLVESGSAP